VVRDRGAGREQQTLDVLVEVVESRDGVHKVHELAPELGHPMTEIKDKAIKSGDNQSKSFRSGLL
jgi:hypothetical protein